MRRPRRSIALSALLGLTAPALFACAHDDLDERLEERAEAHEERAEAHEEQAEAYDEMSDAAERLEGLEDLEVDDDEIERMREELDDALDD